MINGIKTGYHPSEAREKIFESWKTIALVSPDENREARDNKR